MGGQQIIGIDRRSVRITTASKFSICNHWFRHTIPVVVGAHVEGGAGGAGQAVGHIQLPRFCGEYGMARATAARIIATELSL